MSERVRRGVAAGGTNPDDADLHAYYTFQVHVTAFAALLFSSGILPLISATLLLCTYGSN